MAMPRSASRARTGGRLRIAQAARALSAPRFPPQAPQSSEAACGLFSVVLPWPQRTTSGAKPRVSPIVVRAVSAKSACSSSGIPVRSGSASTCGRRRGGDQGGRGAPEPGRNAAGPSVRGGQDRSGDEPAGLGEHERGDAVLPGVVERMAALGLELLAGEPAPCARPPVRRRPAPPCPPSGTGGRGAGRRARPRERCSGAGARRTRRTRRSRSCPPTRGGDGSPRNGRRCSTRSGRRDAGRPRHPSVRAVPAARPGSGARGPATRHCSPGHGPSTRVTPVRRDSTPGHFGGRGRHCCGREVRRATDVGRRVRSPPPDGVIGQTDGHEVDEIQGRARRVRRGPAGPPLGMGRPPGSAANWATNSARHPSRSSPSSSRHQAMASSARSGRSARSARPWRPSSAVCPGRIAPRRATRGRRRHRGSRELGRQECRAPLRYLAVHIDGRVGLVADHPARSSADMTGLTAAATSSHSPLDVSRGDPTGRQGIDEVVGARQTVGPEDHPGHRHRRLESELAQVPERVHRDEGAERPQGTDHPCRLVEFHQEPDVSGGEGVGVAVSVMPRSMREPSRPPASTGGEARAAAPRSAASTPRPVHRCR